MASLSLPEQERGLFSGDFASVLSVLRDEARAIAEICDIGNEDLPRTIAMGAAFKMLWAVDRLENYRDLIERLGKESSTS